LFFGLIFSEVFAFAIFQARKICFIKRIKN
jgi:hypothetical protein